MTLDTKSLLALFIATALAASAACAGNDDAATPTPTNQPTPTVAGESPPPADPTPHPAATTPTPVVGEPAWDGNAPIALDGVPPFLVEAWRSSSASACPAMFYTDLDAIDPDAVPRPAAFPGWGVAWDRLDGPGRDPSGEYCEDCGRSTFGIAPLDTDSALDTAPERLVGSETWSDGSRLGWFNEGFVGPGTLAPVIGHLEIGRYACSYQLWSFAGETQLLDLVDHLRIVESLVPAPGASEPPPWATDPLTLDRIDPVYLLEWIEAGEPGLCPFLAFADLGPQAGGAVARRAENADESLVAWDLPDGPGHDTAGEPCEDCGRGAIGIGTFQGDAAVAEPATRIWFDSSVANITEGLYGTEARIHPAGYDCTYWLWSHLGPDHLEYLISQLRIVER